LITIVGYEASHEDFPNNLTSRSSLAPPKPQPIMTHFLFEPTPPSRQKRS